MADKFIFSYIDKDQNGIFRDMTKTDVNGRLDFLYSHKNMKTHLGKAIKKIALSYKLNAHVSLPFIGFFGNLDQYDYLPQHTYHLLIPTTSIAKFPIHYLERFSKRHKNVKLYAWVTDSIHADSPHMCLVRDKLRSNIWTAVLTYDPYDAKEFGFTWFGYTYYSSFDFVKSDKEHSDIYYSGFNKGRREEEILAIYDYLSKDQVKCRFDIVSKKMNHLSDLKYLSQRIAYPDVVSRVKSTNCILEVLQQGQQVQSLRYFEAILYNKKLLSNNPHLSELPYYDKRYMRYFNSLSDIDIDWIKRKETIHYKYHKEFSPVKILDFIQDILETEKE